MTTGRNVCLSPAIQATQDSGLAAPEWLHAGAKLLCAPFFRKGHLTRLRPAHANLGRVLIPLHPLRTRYGVHSPARLVKARALRSSETQLKLPGKVWLSAHSASCQRAGIRLHIERITQHDVCRGISDEHVKSAWRDLPEHVSIKQHQILGTN